MNLNSKTRKITEVAVITTLMTVFVIIGLYTLPVVMLLYPVPFVILAVRHGTKYNILAIVASSILVAILVDVLIAFFVLVVFGFLSIGLGYMIAKRRSPSQVLIGSTIISLVSTILVINLIGYITGVDFINQIDLAFSEALKMQVELMRDRGFSNYEIARTGDFAKSLIEYAIIIIPSTIIISSAFSAYVNYLVSGAILRRIGYSSIKTPRFAHFKLPNHIIYGAGAMLFATLILRYFRLLYYQTIFINILLLTILIFFIEGLAVTIFLMEKFKVNRVLKGILIFFMIINIPFSMIVSFLGFLDVILDFRKLKRA